MREAEWLEALHNGDMQWFPELVEAYQHRIYALAYRKTGAAADAEDLAQDIFLQFYRKLPLFRGEAALSTWLYRVAFNCAASYRRKAAAWPQEQMPEYDDGSSVDDGLLQLERQMAVHSAMKALSRHEREALELFYFQQYSTARIAEVLGLSARGVETRLRRARIQMKKRLARYFGEEDGNDDAREQGSVGSVASRLP